MSSIIEVVRPVAGYTVGDRYVVEPDQAPWANMLDSGLISVVEGATSLDDGEDAEQVLGEPLEQPAGDTGAAVDPDPADE